MGRESHGTNRTEHSPPFSESLPPPAPPPPPVLSHGALDSNISPSILLIIVILSVIFFISGLLHLLVRFLLRPTSRDPDDLGDATAFQGQLQQLFNLHDAGVDQSFIDTLPVFLYKAIIGAKDPFDCAVCLCEFEGDDKLRLLPKCSHAFHLECIDTWLLSHSTCPLCRSSLLPDFSPARSCSPVVLVLESGSESSREIVADRDPGASAEEDLCSVTSDAPQKAGEVISKEETGSPAIEVPASQLKVVPVKLGKFRNFDGGTEGTSSGNLDQRRCFSMGSCEYVMDETSLLQVAIKPAARKPGINKSRHRLAMSECDSHSQREGFKGFEMSKATIELRREGRGGGARIGSSSQNKESFSVSKIWLRPRKEKNPAAEEGSRRALSFRLPLQRGGAAEEEKETGCSSRGTAADGVDAASCWEKSGSEFSFDVEAGSCDGSVLSRAGETPTFARRTLLWIVGRHHHKVVNHL